MLRVAFMLAALGAAAAQYDKAGRVHEHDEGRRDDWILRGPRNLIALPHNWRIGTHLINDHQLQPMPHGHREDEKHEQNTRTHLATTTSAAAIAPTGAQSSWNLLQNRVCSIANCRWMVRREHSDFLTGTKTYSSARPIFGATQYSRGRTTKAASNVTMSQHHQNKANMTNCWCHARREFDSFEAETKTNT